MRVYLHGVLAVVTRLIVITICIFVLLLVVSADVADVWLSRQWNDVLMITRILSTFGLNFIRV